MNEVSQAGRILSRLTALSLLTVLSACGSETKMPEGSKFGDLIVAIERTDTAEVTKALTRDPQVAQLGQALAREQKNNSFYLAVRKDALGERFFLSSYVRQFYPFGMQTAAGLSLQVVRLEVQNDKLFIFDADDRKKYSELFQPQIIIDAFPVVTDYAPFNKLPGASDYVLFDASAGKNEFAAMGTMQMVGNATLDDAGIPVQTFATFLQNFKSLPDGATFEKVFGGTYLPGDGSMMNLGGTLGIGLRRYSEGEGFVAMDLPAKPHFFGGAASVVPNSSGALKQYAARWNIKPGMKPITWYITPEIADPAKFPQLAKYDVLGAVKQGVERWNTAFGFQVFETKVAGPDDSFADDDKSFIVLMPEPTMGSAVGRLRANPNTGEIRGASVYIGSGFLDSLTANDKDATPAVAGETETTEGQQTETAREFNIAWAGNRSEVLCKLDAKQLRLAQKVAAFAAEANEGEGQTPAPAQPKALTGKETVESLIAGLVSHEVGHTIGLRHNFKGSTTNPAGSIMDYLDASDELRMNGAVGAYDLEAIKYLYQGSGVLPTMPFCTDQDRAVDPDCAMYDRGSDPLNQWWTPNYDFFLDGFLKGDDSFLPVVNYLLPEVARYLFMSPNPDVVLQSYNTILGGTKAPVAADVLAANPAYGERADGHTVSILAAIFVDNAGSVTEPRVVSDATLQLGSILENEDKIRSIEGRRLALDVLKSFQSNDAYATLLMAKKSVDTERRAATGENRDLLEDLWIRLSNALTPYFN